jgi:dipeptidyl aminopeptidase/acylaminoacyl peptidase
VLTTLPGGRLELRSLADGGLEGDATVPGEDLASGWELSADGAFVAAITMGGQLRLVHVASGQRLPGPTGRVTAFRLSPDGNGIVFATSPGAGWFTMRPRRQALVTEGEASAMMVDGSGARGAIGHADGSILVFGTQDGSVLARWKGHEGRVTSLVFAADERTMVSGGADGWLRFWNTTLWREVLRLRFTAGVDWVEPSPDGQRLAVVAGRQLHWLDTTGGNGSTPRSQGAASGFWKSPAASLKGLENRGESTSSAREVR